MTKIKWINHKGKRILYADYSGLSDKEMLTQLVEGAEILMKEKSKVLYFGNFANTIITNEFMNKANVHGKEAKEKYEKMAVVGLTSGVRSILLNTFNMLTGSKMKVFSTEQEALDYLVQ